MDGYVAIDISDRFFVTNAIEMDIRHHVLAPSHITRIDYANARYRGEQPLWEKTS